MSDFTPHQNEILDFVLKVRQARGTPPTRAEINAAFGYGLPRIAANDAGSLLPRAGRWYAAVLAVFAGFKKKKLGRAR